MALYCCEAPFSLPPACKKYNINVAKTVKEKVEEGLVKAMRKERQVIFEKTADLLAGVTEEDIVRAVRRSRKS